MTPLAATPRPTDARLLRRRGSSAQTKSVVSHLLHTHRVSLSPYFPRLLAAGISAVSLKRETTFFDFWVQLPPRWSSGPLTGRTVVGVAAKHTTGKSGLSVPEMRLVTRTGVHVALPLGLCELAQVPNGARHRENARKPGSHPLTSALYFFQNPAPRRANNSPGSSAALQDLVFSWGLFAAQTRKGVHIMFKKIAIASVIVVAGLVLIAKTSVGSYVHTGWKQLKAGTKNQIPLEFEIERAKDEVSQLVPDMNKYFNEMAHEVVALDSLKEDISRT